MTAARIVVHGDVQGVNFRDSVRREAESAGASGWVQNRSDGTVEAHVEGDHEAVGAVVDFCGRGPGNAQVNRVEREDVEPESLAGFEVR
ncbi:MAG: acylphosphatase [Thermoleophilaceae bacterium]